MTEEEKKVLKLAKIYFIILLCCYALAPFHRTVPSTLGISIMNDFNINSAKMSILGAVFFYFYAAMQIPAGILADRFGAKETCIVFLIVGAIGTFLFSLSSNFYIACVGRMIIGVGVAMLFVPGLKLILNWFPPKMHPLCTGLFLSMGTGGMFLASWPLNRLSEMIGWRYSLCLVAVFSLVIAALCQIAIKNNPSEKNLPNWKSEIPQQNKEKVSLKESIIFILKNKSYWAVSIWFFSMYGCFYAFSGLWAGPYFMQGYKLSSEYTAVILSCISAGAIIGPSIFGFVLSVCSISKKVILAAVCLLATFFSVPLVIPAPVLPDGLLPVWFFILSIFLGGSGSIGLIKIQDDFPKNIVGTATGMVNIYTALGGGIIQMVSGWIMNYLNKGTPNTIETYASMFYLFIFLLLLSALCVLIFLSKQPKN